LELGGMGRGRGEDRLRGRGKAGGRRGLLGGRGLGRRDGEEEVAVCGRKVSKEIEEAWRKKQSRTYQFRSRGTAPRWCGALRRLQTSRSRARLPSSARRWNRLRDRVRRARQACPRRGRGGGRARRRSCCRQDGNPCASITSQHASKKGKRKEENEPVHSKVERRSELNLIVSILPNLRTHHNLDLAQALSLPPLFRFRLLLFRRNHNRQDLHFQATWEAIGASGRVDTVEGGRLGNGCGRVGSGRRDGVVDVFGGEEGRVGTGERGPRERVEAILAAVKADWRGKVRE
jgi:hypothetical protein